MPRYLVERTFPQGLQIPVSDDGAKACIGVVDRNAELGVTWVHSYVSDDKRRTFCVHDGPDPETIRKAAERSELPIDRITRVSVLDPYFYRRGIIHEHHTISHSERGCRAFVAGGKSAIIR